MSSDFSTSELSVSRIDDKSVDMQVSTAHKYPRKIDALKQRAMTLATMSADIAEMCFYVLERGGERIVGPSVRLAEIMASCWGNLRVESTIIDIDKKFVTVRGIAWDLEANIAFSTETRRRITTKDGKRFNDDLIAITANAACAIAVRNVVFKVIPLAIVQPIFEKARKVAIGDKTTIQVRRDSMIAAFAKIGVAKEMVLAKLKKEKVEDIGLDDLEHMIGLFTAIRDKETTIENAFSESDHDEPEVDDASKNKESGKSSTKSDELVSRFNAESTGSKSGSENDSEAESRSGGDSVGKSEQSESVSGGTEGSEGVVDAEIVPKGEEFSAEKKSNGRRHKSDKPDKSSETGRDSTENRNRVSHMDECRAYLKSENIPLLVSDPTGVSSQYQTENGRLLILTARMPDQPKDGCDYVDAFTVDALTVVKHLVKVSRESV